MENCILKMEFKIVAKYIKSGAIAQLTRIWVYKKRLKILIK